MQYACVSGRDYPPSRASVAAEAKAGTAIPPSLLVHLSQLGAPTGHGEQISPKRKKTLLKTTGLLRCNGKVHEAA